MCSIQNGTILGFPVNCIYYCCCYCLGKYWLMTYNQIADNIKNKKWVFDGKHVLTSVGGVGVFIKVDVG